MLVEGKDDEHVCGHLLAQHGLAQAIKVEETGGLNKLLDRLPVELKGTGVHRLGVVVDAHESSIQTWQRVRGILLRAGYQPLPESVPENGLVLASRTRISVGVWIMPDNLSPGQIEEFVSLMVPKGDKLWSYAQSCVDRLPERRFRDTHVMKAVVHTWLAWQEDPGVPMGLAVKKRYFDSNSRVARAFLEWSRRLFLYPLEGSV